MVTDGCVDVWDVPKTNTVHPSVRLSMLSHISLDGLAFHISLIPPPTSYLDSINIIIITRYDFYDLVIYPLTGLDYLTGC